MSSSGAKKGLFGLGIAATIIIIVLALVIGLPLLLALCGIVAIVVLTLLGPVIGNTFSGIVEDLE